MVPADEGVFAAFEGLREEWDNHRKNYPFSDCGANPRWARTEGSAAASAPWDSLQPFTALLPAPHGSPEKLYRPDIWHNWHLGHGRYFLSSAFIILGGSFHCGTCNLVKTLIGLKQLVSST